MADDDSPASHAGIGEGYRHERWLKHFEQIDLEIGRLATMCQVQLLDPGNIERVLKNDALVCGKANPAAFAKLRQLLMMHYSVRDQALVSLGEDETMAIIGEVVGRLRTRFGDSLGKPAT
ncbi:MAG: hypothetical protein MUF03_03015 [Rubrivivax sp.]|jgi:hypothetical protein|nr:hypothetical protein [Rubrivivax sp.]